MRRNPKLIVLSIFLLIFLGLLFYNLKIQSLWTLDAATAIAFVLLFFFLSERLNIGWIGFLFACLIPFFHNLGTFGFYNRIILFFGYDKFVHFFNAFIGAVIVAKIIYELMVGKNKKINQKQNLFIVFSIISTVMFVGLCIEFNEFFGYTYFHASWQGMFSPNSLPNPSNMLDYNYNDTMWDLFSDFLGAIVGVFGYYASNYTSNRKQK